jgi:hypothetical protein
MNAKAKARAAAAAAKEQLNTGKTPEVGGTDEGSNVANEGSTGSTAETPPVSAAAVVPVPTASAAPKKEKAKVDIFSEARLQTAAGLRKALWSHKGPVVIAFPGGGQSYEIETTKASFIKHLTAIVDAKGENAPSPWIFTKRRDASGKETSGSVLTDVSTVQSAGRRSTDNSPAQPAPTTASAGSGTEDPSANAGEQSGETQKSEAEPATTT